MRTASSHEKLSAYIDGELSGRAMRKIEKHLEDCPACRAKLRELTGVSAMLEMLDPPSPPSDRFFQHVAKQCLASPVESSFAGPVWPRWAWMGMPVAALLTVGLAAGLWGWMNHGEQGSPGDESPGRVAQKKTVSEGVPSDPSVFSEVEVAWSGMASFPEADSPWQTKRTWNAAEEILLMQASIDLGQTDSQFAPHPDAWGGAGSHVMPASWSGPVPVHTPARKEKDH